MSECVRNYHIKNLDVVEIKMLSVLTALYTLRVYENLAFKQVETASEKSEFNNNRKKYL